jgi:hypothetical protein
MKVVLLCCCYCCWHAGTQELVVCFTAIMLTWVPTPLPPHLLAACVSAVTAATVAAAAMQATMAPQPLPPSGGNQTGRLTREHTPTGAARRTASSRSHCLRTRVRRQIDNGFQLGFVCDTAMNPMVCLPGTQCLDSRFNASHHWCALLWGCWVVRQGFREPPSCRIPF